MLKKMGILMIAAALGAGAPAALTACGEDREGEVEFQDGGTDTAGTGTATAPSTETAPSTQTAPETETEAGGETAPETETAP
jgi:hypothetical protein